jgi:hypothetical protein
VVLWTDTPISTVELCSSFRVIFGLFVASQINALLARSVSFGGRPSLGRFVVVPYSLHFLIRDLMVLRGIFKVSFFYIQNPGLYFSTTLFLTCLGSSLVFMVPLARWCPLLSGVRFWGLSEQMYIY